MLLAGREGEHPAALAIDIDGLAGEPPRHLPQELLLAGEEADIRSAEAEGIADRLAFRYGDVAAGISRRADQTVGDDLGRDRNHQSTGSVRGLRQSRKINEMTE